MTLEMWEFEKKIKKESPPVNNEVEHYDTGQFFETDTGRKFRLYSPIFRGRISEGKTEILGYWFREISDNPCEYFYKSRQAVHDAIKSGKVRFV